MWKRIWKAVFKTIEAALVLWTGIRVVLWWIGDYQTAESLVEDRSRIVTGLQRILFHPLFALAAVLLIFGLDWHFTFSAETHRKRKITAYGLMVCGGLLAAALSIHVWWTTPPQVSIASAQAVQKPEPSVVTAPLIVTGMRMQPYVVGQPLAADVVVDVRADDVVTQVFCAILIVSMNGRFTASSGGPEPHLDPHFDVFGRSAEMLAYAMWETDVAHRTLFSPPRQETRGLVTKRFFSQGPLTAAARRSLTGKEPTAIALVLGKIHYGGVPTTQLIFRCT